MTLAEVFLLLLVVGWYGSRLESEGTGLSMSVPAVVSKVDFDQSEQFRRDAEDKLAKQTREFDQLERILDWIAKTAGLPKPIRDLDHAKKAVDIVRAEARRGRPACAQDNVLVDVSADSGAVLATVRQEFLAKGHSYASGEKLKSDEQIAMFLQDVDAFYQGKTKESSSVCVFDFTLAWRTDADYRGARELFEHHFYPARIRQFK